MTSSLAQLTANSLVKVTGHPGTHTVRQSIPDENAPTHHLVDVLGALLQVPVAEVAAHPGTPPDRAPHKVWTGPDHGVDTAGALNTARDLVRAAKFTTGPRPTLTDFAFRRNEAYSAFAQIAVRPRLLGATATGKPKPLSTQGLQLDVVVSGNLAHTAAPYDLVPIFLQTPNGTLDTIVVLTPTWGPEECNVISFTASYTLAQLAALTGVVLPDDPAEQVAKLETEVPELGVRAEWRAFNGATNAANHASGGVLNKGGSGKVRLVPPSREDLVAAEKVRVLEWNLSEDLAEGRPVFDTFGDVLQGGPGKELATTLEAEAEYVLPGKAEHQHVLQRLDHLVDDPHTQGLLGIESIETDHKVKTYTDTYYDAFAQKVCRWTLLSRQVVLRRRSVNTDEGDVNLFAVKGRRRQRQAGGRTKPEFIRIAAQVQVVANPDPARLTQFLSDTSTDNAVGRILATAVTTTAISGPSIAESARPQWPEGKWVFGPALEVTSLRRKYVIHLANSVTVEVSVDAATAKCLAPTTGKALPDVDPVYCFEFGVGHPALVTAAVTGAPVATTSSQPGVPQVSRVSRPYHVDADLAPALFEKVDYAQYHRVAEAVLDWLFPDGGRAGLKLGGNKAALLASKLGLVKEPR